jgi:hypothetical protein
MTAPAKEDDEALAYIVLLARRLPVRVRRGPNAGWAN